jgi:hypothetical protein
LRINEKAFEPEHLYVAIWVNNLGLAANLALVKAQRKPRAGSNNTRPCCIRAIPVKSPRRSLNLLSNSLHKAKDYANMLVILRSTSTT